MSKKLIKMAYKMPPQENWNRFRDERQENPNFINEEHYAKIVEAGFTHGIGLLEHGADIAERALSVADKVGLKYYVRDAVNWANVLHPDYYYYNAENYLKHKKHPSFAGIYVCDEPNANKYGDLCKMVKGYQAFFNGVGEPLVNLLPTYANEVEQLGAESYRVYIEEYAKKVPTDYIMFDHYPIRVKDRKEEYLRDDYLYNCQIVASICKQYKKDYRAFVQSSIMDMGEQDIVAEAIPFQVHVHLSHGATALAYYYYWGNEQDEKTAGIVDWNGNPSHLYEAVKKTHLEVGKYEEKLLEFVWQDCLYVKGSEKHHNESEFSRFSCEKGNFKSQYDLVVGCFKKQEKEAYYLVNYTNPRLKLENIVEINLDSDAEIWVGGTAKKLKRGTNKIVLPCGGGAFIVKE